ncbi:MAG: polyprenyl synthetase family protein, partial [Chloroflexota bacterium]
MLKLEERLRSVVNVDFPWLAQILEHILKLRGKRMRPAITLLSGRLYPSNNHETLIPMAAGIELLHTATLVHDDTIDNCQLRRGTATANSIWNSSTVVLVGDYLFANAAYLVSTTGSVLAMRLFAQALMVICSGELRQNHSSFDWRQSRESYYQRIGRKTASLFSIAAETGGILSGAPPEKIAALHNYGHNLGLAFQIVDDVLDFAGDENEMGKP